MSEFGHVPNEEQKTSNKEQEINELIGHLHLFDSYSEEMPDEIIRSDAKDNKYKVRVGWYQGVIAAAEETLYQIGMENPATSEIQELVDNFSSDDFKVKNQSKTTREDMEMGNRLIKLCLKALGRE